MEATEKTSRTVLNRSEAAQLKQLDESEHCPTCGSPMQAAPMDESESAEQGGSHGRMARITQTDFPGYRTRAMKRGEKIGGAY